MPELTVDEMTVEYASGGYTIRPLNNFSMQAPSGSLTILLGPSGCGKTTLLSCLGAMITPKAGTISFGDTRIDALSGSALAQFRRETVGFVFQGFNLVPSMTARQNVMVPMRAAGVNRSDARRRADDLLGQVGLENQLDRKPGAMSGGQQQRVAIARSLANKPTLLLADEPTANLDFIMVEEVIGQVRRLASQERVVVVATHDERLVPVADQVIEMVPRFLKQDLEPQHVEVAAGQVLFRQGDNSDLVYVIEEGTIDIVRELADGGEEHRSTLGPGEYFGELGPLLGMPRSATARAHTSTTLTGYTQRDFRERINTAGVPALFDHPLDE